MSAKLEADLILQKQPRPIGGRVRLRLHVAGHIPWPLHILRRGVQAIAEIVPAQSLVEHARHTPGARLVLGNVAHAGVGGQRLRIRRVFRLGALDIQARIGLVGPAVVRCPLVHQLQRVAAGVAVLLRIFGDKGAGRVPAKEVRVVLAPVQIKRQFKPVGRIDAQCALEQQGIGMPVVGHAVDDIAVVARGMAVAPRITDQAVQLAAFAGSGHALVPGAVGRVVAQFAAKIRHLVAAQIIVRRLGLEAHGPADAARRARGRGGAGQDIDRGKHLRIDKVATDAKRIDAGPAHVRTGGGIGHLNAVDIHADPVALNAADVIACRAGTVKAAAVAGRPRRRARRGHQRLIAHHILHIVGAIEFIATDGGRRAGLGQCLLAHLNRRQCLHEWGLAAAGFLGQCRCQEQGGDGAGQRRANQHGGTAMACSQAPLRERIP